MGPVAIVSLLTGTLIAKWQPDYLTNKEGAMDTAAQASLCTGIVSTYQGVYSMSIVVFDLPFVIVSYTIIVTFSLCFLLFESTIEYRILAFTIDC